MVAADRPDLRPSLVSRTVSRRKKANRTTDAPLVASHRKREVAGLLLMTVAFLVALALVSFSAADAGAVRRITWLDALLPIGVDESVNNVLGLVGAKLSHFLIVGLLGYPVLLLCGLALSWGYVLFRQREPIYLPLLSGLLVVGTVLISMLFGWFADGGETALAYWSGNVGMALAGWLKGAFGAVGSLILIFVLLAVTMLLFIDRDIQLSLDRVEATVDQLRGQTAERWLEAKEAHNRRVAIRAEKRAARRDALANAPPPPAPATAPSTPATPPAPVAQTSEPPATTGSPAAQSKSTRATDSDDDLLESIVARHSGRDKSSGDDGPPLKVLGPKDEAPGDLAARRKQPGADDDRFDFPDLELLDAADTAATVDLEEIEENKRVLLDKLETYNVQITEINAVVGPTVTRYELIPAPGIRISRITALEDDLAMAMAAPGIRILAPIPGKGAIGVEIPNRHRELVRLSSILGTARFTEAKNALPVALGKNIQGEVHIEDLAKMPHMLIAGATGAGKSVGLNATIVGLMFACRPSELKFVMIDPKKIELGPYQQLLDHYIAMPEGSEEPVITDFREAAGVLRCCEREMEERYDRLAEAGVRGIKEYNERVRSGQLRAEDGHDYLPYIVVIVDELADLMMTSGKEVEPPIARLAQMARAVGIHLILATQRPSVDVITGLIKANFPSRIAYQVASKIDSRTILDQGGAEQLVGNGDLLYMNGSRIQRLQGPFVSNDEIERVVAFIARQPGTGPYMLPPI